jgi:uncharacterized protein (TIGR03545 family)
MAVKIFRWKAIGPLLLLLVIIGVLVVIFAEPVARSTSEEVGTELLGTELDIGKLDLLPREASVRLERLQLADPFEPRRNLVEAAQIQLKLNPEALTEKKLVIENFALNGMRFGTTRTKPARPVKGGGFAPTTLRAVRAWAKQFDVPLLQLTPIDTVKQLVLNPTQLGSVQAAQDLAARTDSTRRALEQGFKAVDVDGTIDSARALVTRLRGADPKKLGIDGTRQAIESIKKTLDRLGQTKQQVANLGSRVKDGVRLLGSGVQAVDEARKRDYAFARSLLKLPSFSAPDIGNAFFGKVSIDRFQQALYWAELARHYMPPGLLPRENAGPKRLRMDGTNIMFPKEHDWPSFLLQLGQIDFTVDKALGPLEGAYKAKIQGLTSEPALYGKPMLVSASRSAAGSAIAGMDVGALVDHVGPTARDSVSARLRGVKLPAFDIPGLPFRLTPGVGAANLTFALRGEQLRGHWNVASDAVTWTLDSAGSHGNSLEQIVWRVVSGLKSLNVTADVAGTVKAPRLSVSSNLDRAIASRLEAVIGEEVAKAEAMARAKVDSLVDQKIGPVKQRVAALQADVGGRLASQQKGLDEVERQLQEQLARLSGNVVPGLKLPKLKLSLQAIPPPQLQPPSRGVMPG